MSAFVYHDGRLHAEGVPLDDIAAAIGTPCYVYAANAMRQRLRALLDAFGEPAPLVCYAVKANNNLAVVRVLAAAGAGADTVSGGEIRRARAAGVAPERIVLAGVAKTDDEIALALREGVLQLNVESLQELERIDAVARGLGKRAPIALRVNPDVAAGTHDKITTGRRIDKFGLPFGQARAAYARALELSGVEPVGLHLHIGSQITSLEPFEAAYGKAVSLYRELRAAGVPLRRLDLGGGLGVRYQKETPVDPLAFAALVRRLTAGLDAELVLEPGRWLVAEAGVLVASVIDVKQGEDRRFLVLDAGMHTLIRPALYGARHAILPLRDAPERRHLVPMDVVGPICESSDIFGRDYHLPPLRPGDRVALMAAGAYGAVMASDYNSRPSPAEVLVDGDRFAPIRARRSPEAQLAADRIPDWLTPPD